MKRLRSTQLLACVALVLATARCAPGERVTVYRIADYVDTAAFHIPPGQLLPTSDAVRDHLGTGWVIEPEGQRATVQGVRASFSFEASDRGPLDIELEVRALPHPEGIQQTVLLLVNDQEVSSVPVDSRWTPIVFEVPEAVRLIGYNRAVLRFEYAAPPDAAAVASGETRRFAARVRKLQVGPQPAALRPSLELSEADAPPAVNMPHNGVLRLFAEVPTDAALDVDLAPTGEPGSIAAIDMETFGEDGEPGQVRLLEADAEFGVAQSIDLSSVAGRTVALRVRVQGSGAVQASWRQLEIRSPESAVPAAARPFAALENPVPPPEPSNPDIYLIILDAARADAFSPYGTPRPTPAVQALANAGTTFLDAYSAAPWTGQGMPSMLTGRDPEAHGVDRWGRPLPESIPLLQEVIGQRGYHTVLWTQHTMYKGNASLRRGFDRYEALDIEVPLPPDPDVLFADGVPTFALLHYLPPHGPYAPPEPFRGTYSDWAEEPYQINGQFLHRFPRLLDPSEMTPDHVRYVRDRYDEHVAYADSIVEEIVQLLKDHSRYDDALIIVTSDHGEAFFEHQFFLHTRFLYDEVLRVPLVVKWPAGVTGHRPAVEGATSTTQLPATVAELMGIASPGPGFQGRSLLPAAFEGEPSDPVLFYSSRGVGSPSAQPNWMAALRVGMEKLHHYTRGDMVELYDLATDPAEQDNLAESRPARTEFLLQQLLLRQSLSEKLRLAAGTTGADSELDEETIRELRALGYLQ